MSSQKEIEKYFLRFLLRILFAGTILIITTDFLFQEHFLQYDAIVDFILLAAVLLSFLLFRLGHFNSSVLVITLVSLASMLYQSITLPQAATMSFSVILVVGFVYSILLKGNLRYFMHGVTLTGMLAAFTWQALHPGFYHQPNSGEVITMGFTYFVLYIIISYSASYLKMQYDTLHEDLKLKNSELLEKTYEIEAQNEELIQGQQNLNELNLNLEKMVSERTNRISSQNEQLIRYSYNNAHHLRGPVARVLGLIAISKIEQSPDFAFLFSKIEEQTLEIDSVVQKIARELEENGLQS